MQVAIDEGGVQRLVVANEGESVLDVLQRERVGIRATCGGVGTCGRCQVLVRDGTGLGHRLACATPVVDGMEVVVECMGAMEAVQSGLSLGFAPDEDATGFGMAVDVGTTTLVAHLHDLASGNRIATIARANPQIAFGSDVISRISASVDGKLALMVDGIRDALAEMRDALCAEAGASAGDVAKVSIAGNTVMQHIVAGLAPDAIGVSPFTPLSLFGDVREIPGLGRCRFARCIAGYVGGDVAAGMVARRLDGGETRLFLDLGTNGEMALAHGGHIICCATAAGPVFEGANVKFGMPASPGAIAKVSFANGAFETRVIGGMAPIGLCGTGLIDAVAAMTDLGIVDETGRLLGTDELEGAAASLVGREEGDNVCYLVDDRSVYVTQSDVRNLQLAKAAVRAGIHTMFDEAGIGAGAVASLEIAGGFGAYLDLASAARIGLFPPELEPRASSVGNTSGEGAAALLVSAEARSLEGRIADSCDYLELSTSSQFGGHYLEQMEF